MLITPTRADYLKERATPAFLDSRLVWLAIGVARARRIPIGGLLNGLTIQDVFEDQAIPRFIREGRLFDTAESYVANLSRRLRKARRLPVRQHGLQCYVCLCNEGSSASTSIMKRLGGVGFNFDLWRPSSSVDGYDAAVVLPGTEPSDDWKVLSLSFLEDLARRGKPVAFLALQGTQEQPEVLELLPPALCVEYHESDNLSFLQLAWAIVGYRQFDLGSEKPTPRVFISYSWDSEAHKAWVAELAARLRADGVDVILDQWHVRLGDQLLLTEPTKIHSRVAAR